MQTSCVRCLLVHRHHIFLQCAQCSRISQPLHSVGTVNTDLCPQKAAPACRDRFAIIYGFLVHCTHVVIETHVEQIPYIPSPVRVRVLPIALANVRLTRAMAHAISALWFAYSSWNSRPTDGSQTETFVHALRQSLNC